MRNFIIKQLLKKMILRIFSLLILILTGHACDETNKKKEVVFLGVVHDPIENFNADSLFKIIVDLDPDLILFEVDSSFFTDDFQFNRTWESNELDAVRRYMDKYPVMVRPYDFTNRNEYRVKIGSRPTDGKALNLLDSLFLKGSLSLSDSLIYKSYVETTDTLVSFAYMGALAFNNKTTDSIASKRQNLLYNALLKVMQNYPIFANTFHIKENGDSISYLKGFSLAGKFWEMRNKAMANHILYFVENTDAERIAVQCGYFHRYYLKEILSPLQEQKNFTIKEFNEFIR